MGSSPGVEQSLPAEVSVAEAARLLGVSSKTVRVYIRDGALRWRDIAPPSSSRATLRIELESVMALRTSYRSSVPPAAPARDRRRPRLAAGRRKLRHIRYWHSD